MEAALAAQPARERRSRATPSTGRRAAGYSGSPSCGPRAPSRHGAISSRRWRLRAAQDCRSFRSLVSVTSGSPVRGPGSALRRARAERGGRRIAEEHGWDGGSGGRYRLGHGGDRAALARAIRRGRAVACAAQRAMRPDGEPGTELLVHHMRRASSALYRAGRARRWRASAKPSGCTDPAGRRARRSPWLPRRGCFRHRRGWDSSCRARRARGASAEERNGPRCVSPTRSSASRKDDAEQAVDVLAPVIEGSAPALHRPSAIVEAPCSTPWPEIRWATPARPRTRSSGRSTSRSRNGIILPFALAPVASLLERHPAPQNLPADAALGDHRPALRLLGRRAVSAAPLRERAQRGRASRRPLPAEQPEGVGDRGRAVRVPHTRAPTCDTSIPSSTRTAGARRSTARASSGCSPRPGTGSAGRRQSPTRLAENHPAYVTTAHPSGADGEGMSPQSRHRLPPRRPATPGHRGLAPWLAVPINAVWPWTQGPKPGPRTQLGRTLRIPPHPERPEP